MKISLKNLNIAPKTLFALMLLAFQIFFVSNSFAIKLTLNDSSELILNEDVVYDYTIVNPNNLIKSVKTNTQEPYLCLGPSAPAVVPNLILGPSMSDLFEVYGLVGISSAMYTYNIDPNLAVFSVITDTTSQCVVKGFSKVPNPNPGNPLIFIDSFEDSSPSIPSSVDLSVEMLNANGVDVLLDNVIVSDGNDYTYIYEITNIGDSPVTFDVVDYFSQTNNSTTWSCTESVGAVVATSCGVNFINPDFNMGTAVDYNQAVYLKGVHIENNGESVIITVTRNPSIAADNTPIDLLLTTIVTDGNDFYRLNNSDTRVFIGNTNAIPTIATIPDTTILEDAATGSLAFTVGDLETPVANLIVTATSSNQNIVADANITIGGSGMSRTVSVVANLNANTASGPVTITLQVADANGGIQTSSFLLNITPVNDKPTFSVPTISDYPAGTTGNQLVSNFIQNVIYGPTIDESSQILVGNPIITNVSDTNGVLSSSLTLGTDLFIPLSGQGGTVTFDVQVQDNGSTANGGTDTSDPVSVSFTVLNTLPTISMVSNTSTNEDNSTPAIAFTVSDAETAAGSLTMSATNTGSSISSIQFPAFTGGSRTVIVTPAMDQNTDGVSPVTITLIVSDGADTSQTTFDLVINPVNDAPSFALGSNILWPMSESGLKQHASFANNIVMGPTLDETSVQTPVQFNVSISGGTIFSSSPTIDISGSLAYVLNGASGVATIQVSLQDDGMTANGGVDTSATQSFTITVQ